MTNQQRILSILYDIKTLGMFASLVIVTYTFLFIMVNGKMTWSEPNKLILYSEVIFLALSWVGWIIQTASKKPSQHSKSG